CGAAVGHALGSAPTAGAEDPAASAGVGLSADEVSESEPHAASVMTHDATHATKATEGDTREDFTVVTVHLVDGEKLTARADSEPAVHVAQVPVRIPHRARSSATAPR